MLIYGDPSFRATPGALVNRLRQRITIGTRTTVESLRALLIQTGQLEQALEDGDQVPWPVIACSRHLTEMAAQAFCHAWRRPEQKVDSTRGILTALQTLSRELARFSSIRDTMLLIKVPEGFEFYALYPEQYCLAAEDWSRGHAKAQARQVAVIGVRSIGTTLSAVVACVLTHTGWRVCRRTVRPQGHPFERTTELPRAELQKCRYGLVVDEGPGLSGSSMAAAAEAMFRAGVQQISFLPGHTGNPGAAASERVRARWRRTPKFVTRLDAITWTGQSLSHLLQERTKMLLQRPESGLHFVNLSSGAWHEQISTRPTLPEATSVVFERTKFLISAGTEGILWKFTGLGALRNDRQTQIEIENERARALESWVPNPVEALHGFIATPWLRGRHLEMGDAAEAKVLEHISRYIAAASSTPLGTTDRETSLSRLSRMLETNAEAALGNEVIEPCRTLIAQAGKACEASYGDGRMAPHEWVSTPAGQIIKTDFAGHATDHTLVGAQSFLWDVAGFVVEWNLSGDQLERVIETLRVCGLAVRQEALPFYIASYAAFRLGMLWAQQLTLPDSGLPPINLYQRALLQALQAGGTRLMQCA